MRQERIIQASLYDLFGSHEIGRELKAMSVRLDQQRDVLRLVADDLRRHGVKDTGRQGLPAETVLRAALLKQYRQLSYQELAFHLEDSASFRAFARLPRGWSPKKSALQTTISAIRAATWEAVNQAVLAGARAEKLERGRVIRIDSTATAALMHKPSDSSLLWDAVRVMVRRLQEAEALRGDTAIVWRNHRRLAKKRAQAIEFGRNKAKRVQFYRDLIAVTKATLGYLEAAAAQLATLPDVAIIVWQAQVQHDLPLIAQIIDQSERRVLNGETVPAQDKLVSLFETHADIIVKGSRSPCYGHKLNLISGQSGLILDVVVESGNPADSARFLPMLDRHIAFFGEPPRQAAADGGFASRDNLKQAKARGVTDVAFHKKSGLTIEAMVKSRWVYRKLRNFRAGIEAGISCLKRAFGLARVTWRGLAHFKAYVWSSVVAYNLALLARLKPG
jgi:IS5 family transposase